MNNFNFDRCLKFVFYHGDLGTYKVKNAEGKTETKNVEFVVEYNPRKASYLCPRLEATITDTPSSTLKNRQGYEAELKIYNPSEDILKCVSAGATYISDYTDVQDYYSHRLRVSVYAGYYEKAPATLKKEEKLPHKTKKDTVVIKKSSLSQESATYGEFLFDGYVNNSLLVHNSTDSVLTLMCHDIVFSQHQFNQVKADSAKKDTAQFSKDMQDKRLKPGYDTFDQNLRWLIQHFTGVDMLSEEPSVGDTLFNTDSKPIKILYVLSPSAFLETVSTVASYKELVAGDRGYIDENLKVRAKDDVLNPVKSKGFYALGSFLDDTISELCTWAGEGITFRRFDLLGKTFYVIYKGNNRQNTVDIKTKGIVKIINFQNLLSTPTAAPNGSLTIQMLLNKDCKCWKHIALVLDSNYTGNQEETGVLNINSLNFAQNKYRQLIVPLGGTTNNAAIATTQLSTSMNLSCMAHYKNVAAKNGYMFNIGFLITKVVHKLSTHGKDWSTTVQTVPQAYGVAK